MIADNGHLLQEEEKLVEAFLGQRVSGMILHNTLHTERTMAMISNAGIPVVETGDLIAEPMDMSVSYSNFEASKATTIFLAEQGYKRTIFVAMISQNNNRARLRRDGYLAALNELDIKVDDSRLPQVWKRAEMH